MYGWKDIHNEFGPVPYRTLAFRGPLLTKRKTEKKLNKNIGLSTYKKRI